MTSEEYDPATKLWTTVFGVIVMLLVQWPILLAPRLDHPPRDGSFVGNVVAVLIGLAVPTLWLAADLRRYRLGLRWVVVLALITVWVVISFALVNR